jgi:hypothetical protein
MGLFTDRAPTAKFTKIGDATGGKIVDIGKSHRTEFMRDGSIGQPMYWFNGKPVPGVAVDPQTGQENRPVEDPVVTVDTGKADEYGNTERRIFIKGSGDLAAVKAACVAAGVRDIEIGGHLTKTWASGAGGTADPRKYTYAYFPPVPHDAVLPAGTQVIAAKDAGTWIEKEQKKAAARKAAQTEEPPF